MQGGIEKLNELMWGYRAARALHVLAGLRVFTHLHQGPMDAAAIAAACGAEPKLLEKLLIAGAAMGLLQRQGDRYANTPLASTYLVEGQPLYQGHMIAHSAMVWDVWGALPEKVGLTAPADKDAVEHRNFILAMYDITMAGRGQIFLNAVDLSGRRSLLDIGGGPGTFSILACQCYPQLRATVFDLPETLAIARTVIAEHGLSERIDLRPGSWETDDFGSGYDVALMSNILHGPDELADSKLKKAFLALNPGGLLAVQEFALYDDKTGPLIPALFNVMVGAYSRAELAAVIKKAGFSDIRPVSSNDAIGSYWLTATRR